MRVKKKPALKKVTTTSGCKAVTKKEQQKSAKRIKGESAKYKKKENLFVF